MLRYCVQKYGQKRVAQIVTFGTMAPKMAIKDVARVQKLALSESDRLSKLVPDKVTPDKKHGETPFDFVYKESPELAAERESPNQLIRNTLKYAEKLEGSIRQTGVHACGVIIGQDDLENFAPMAIAKDAELNVVEFEGKEVESVGLIKMDFLGLRTLSIIKDAVENVKAVHGVDVAIDDIPLDDAPTYEVFARGDTTGLFQFESPGMKKHLRNLKPNRFEDLIAMNALYRPGPMEYIPNFIARKHGQEPVTYEIADMEEYLSDTYGITVYQEQVMLLSQKLAGFTGGEADTLRKAMGKKKRDVLDKMKPKFIEGAKKNGHDPKICEKIWGDWEAFASYAFNKSHSTCYAYVSYQTAYLKAHYPAEFMAALLQGAATNKNKTALYLGEARRMGIQVLSPDVNESVYEYSAVGDVVRFGLGAIRNVGENAVKDIIAERETGRGKYVNFMDFIRRVPLTALNRRLVESLIKAGAFDSIDPNRRALFTVHESAIDSVVGLKRKQAEGQFDLFSDTEDSGADAMGDATVAVPDIEEWDKKDKLKFERDMLGLYVSDHPLSGMQAVLAGMREMSIAHLIDRAPTMPSGQQVTLAGLITNVDRRVSKKGNPWAIVTIEDMESSIQCMFFGKVYEAASTELIQDAVVQVRGQVEVRDETVSMRATEMQPVALETDDERPFLITLPLVALGRGNMQQLAQIITRHPGFCEVRLAVLDAKGNAQVMTFGDRFRVKRDTSLFAEIKSLFGPSCLPTA